jgi:hypothetical protein
VRTALLIATAVCMAATLTQAQDQIVPAGTLLRCTIDEPEISSKRVEVGDPILCHLGSVNLFGTPAFPRGAYLAGRFEDFRSPGHFYGKGWIKLSFDRIVLPDEAVTVSAKLIDARRLKVNKKGDIMGRGHAKRDAAAWMLPPLWPVDVVMLPRRGPRPALRGETPLTLRLMEDIVVPAPSRRLTRVVPSAPRANDIPSSQPSGVVRPAVPELLSPVSEQVKSSAPYETAGETKTVLALKNGGAYIVSDYWVEQEGRLRMTLANGDSKLLPVSSIDLGTTVELNRQRGVKFVLKSASADDWQ